MANYQVPLGFRFLPTDEEIVRIFLYKMVVKGEALRPPYNAVMHSEDLFHAKEPWKIWEQYGCNEVQNGDLYFYCQLKCMGQKGSRIDRKVGSGGTWSEGEPSKLVYNREVQENDPNPNFAVGRKRKFRYETEHPKLKEQNGRWFLDEFSIFITDEHSKKKHSTNTSYDCDFVICRLRKNPRSPPAKKGKRSSSSSQDQPNPNPTDMFQKANKKRTYGFSQEQPDPTDRKGKQDQLESPMVGTQPLLVNENFELDEMFPGLRQQVHAGRRQQVPSDDFRSSNFNFHCEYM